MTVHWITTVTGLFVACLPLGSCDVFSDCTIDEAAEFLEELSTDDAPPSFAPGCEPQRNGCGPSGPLGDAIPECPLGLACFTEACHSHDLCYLSCDSCRRACDVKFLRDLRRTCDTAYEKGDVLHTRCLMLANVYYEAVALFAQDQFVFSQLYACSCAGLPAPMLRLFAEEFRATPIKNSPGDTDGDLLPDDWESTVGLNPADPADALFDSDGDGLANLTEFIHDLDPCRADDEDPRDFEPVIIGSHRSLEYLGAMP